MGPAPTELEMEGFGMIIILKVSFNQKQATKENGGLGFISIFYWLLLRSTFMCYLG